MKKKFFTFFFTFLVTFYILAILLHRPHESDKEKSELQKNTVHKAERKATSVASIRPKHVKTKSDRNVVRVRKIFLSPKLLAAINQSHKVATSGKKSLKTATKISTRNKDVYKTREKKKPLLAAAENVMGDYKKNMSAHFPNARPASIPRRNTRDIWIAKQTKLLPHKNIRVSRQHSVSGGRLLKEGLKLPVIEASYEAIGFKTYLNRMQSLGGRLFLGDAHTRRIISEVSIYFYNGRHRFLRILDFGSNLEDMALFRPREIIGEPLVNEILQAARQDLGSGSDLRCVVLLPNEIETGLLGSLKQYLENNNFSIQQFSVVHARYFINGNALGLKLETAKDRRTGEIIRLGLEVTI